METAEYDLVLKVQEKHWWWLSRQRLIERLIKIYCYNDQSLKIADVGSGFGANIPMLLRYGEVTALEMNESALSYVSQKWANDLKVKAQQWSSPNPVEERFDLILLADVLEHIGDDTSVVNWIWDQLKPGGYAILTVPAHQYLWTEMDDVVHHVRRYSYSTFAKLFSRQFCIRFISYYNLVLFPVKLLFVGVVRSLRWLSPNRPKRSYNDIPPFLVNTALKSIANLESAVVPRIRLPFGVSLIILAQRVADR